MWDRDLIFSMHLNRVCPRHRVEKYIGRKMLGFYNVDLCDKSAMAKCFSKVRSTISTE